MSDWVKFYDFKHSVIYVNARHRDVHYRRIAEDIRAYVPSPAARVLDSVSYTHLTLPTIYSV